MAAPVIGREHSIDAFVPQPGRAPLPAIAAILRGLFLSAQHALWMDGFHRAPLPLNTLEA
jgi:hypothetical protein